MNKRSETLKDYLEAQMERYNEMPTAINPQHYRNGDIECIDAIAAATVNKPGIQAVCVANIIKYLWRYECKGGIEDVRKAQWYLERLISELTHK
jgi:hypothetical protein